MRILTAAQSLFFSFLFHLQVFGEPIPLVIDESIKSRVSDKYLNAAHGIIPHQLDIDHLKLAILEGAYNNKKVRWFLNNEGENHYVFRRDYNRQVLFTRVEFDDKNIQFKYVDSPNGFACITNIADICYDNDSRKYYGYMKRLKLSMIKSITEEEKRMRRSEK